VAETSGYRLKKSTIDNVCELMSVLLQHASSGSFFWSFDPSCRSEHGSPKSLLLDNMSNLTLYLRPPPSNFGVEDAAAASTLVSQRQQLHDKVERLFRDRCSRSMRGELKIYILQTLKQLRVRLCLSLS
jgi:hypothetical protein